MLEHFARPRHDRLIAAVIAREPLGRKRDATAFFNNLAYRTDRKPIGRIILFGNNLIQTEDKREFFAVKLAATRHHIGDSGIRGATYVHMVNPR